MRACRHADRGPCECPTNVEMPVYVGGQPFPCDYWGKAPVRAEFVTAIEAFLTHKAIEGSVWSPGELVDDLILKGLIPNELRHTVDG